MKAKVTITFTVDSHQLGWQEHGKPFGLTRKQYIKACIRSDVEGSNLPSSARIQLEWLRSSGPRNNKRK